ncbi:MAG TPA: alpha/beta fold hydrolase [Flavitalea sp.]|nr:alpha/beta fold hydrolase [Flavitalea sp.]
MRRALHYFVFLTFIGLMTESCKKHGIGGGREDIPAETDPPLLTPVVQKVNRRVQGYYAGLPARYHETTAKYPLMIFYHGGGQYGNGESDLYKVLQEGVPKLLDEKKFPPSFTVKGKAFSFIIIAPQFVKAPTVADTDTLVRYLKENYRVDTKRIYLVGFSLGARFLSDYAAAYPDSIASVVSMAGLPAIDGALAAKCGKMAGANLPVWHFHNMDDRAWYYYEAERYIEVLRGFNSPNPPRFTSFEFGTARLNHDCWTKAMDPEYKEDDMNIYEWMLQYSRI